MERRWLNVMRSDIGMTRNFTRVVDKDCCNVYFTLVYNVNIKLLYCML